MKKVIIPILVAIILAVCLAIFLPKEKKIDDKKEEKKMTTTKQEEKKIEKDLMEGITINYHASIRIEKDNKVLYFDPFKITDSKKDANYIFLTHSHYDHFDLASIKNVMNNETKFIVTSDLEDKISAIGVSSENILVAFPNNNYKIDDIKFDAITAYNTNKSFHKKSYNWVGYNVLLDDSKYYVVGDSDITDEMKSVKTDVIFIPVGGTYTMTDSEAASVVNEMKPKYAVPIHYDEAGSSENAKVFISKLNDDIKGVIVR